MSVPCSFTGKGGLDAAEHQVAAHAGGEVEHDIDIGRADALGDLAEQVAPARGGPGLGIAHMAMDDGGPGFGGIDGGGGDIPRGHRHMVRAPDRGAGAGDGAGDEDVAVHRQGHVDPPA
jgi:hypothetical protein